MMTTMRTLIRTTILLAAVVALLASADPAGATPQKRLTDSNAGGAEAICGAMGGFSSTVATGNVQVDTGGSKSKTKTSTTECSGGFLGGMTCDNYSNGSSDCAMSLQTGGGPMGSAPLDTGQGTVTGGVTEIEPPEEAVIAADTAPASDGAEPVEAPTEAGEATDGLGDTSEPATAGDIVEPPTVVTATDPAVAGATVAVAAPGAHDDVAAELEPEESSV